MFCDRRKKRRDDEDGERTEGTEGKGEDMGRYSDTLYALLGAT